MTNREANERVRRAFTAATPDLSDLALSGLGEQKGKVSYMAEARRTRTPARRFAGVAAALFLTLGTLAGFRAYGANYAVASTVSLDVNPSIEIRVNQKERVLAVNARNDDARVVLGDMKLEGGTLDVAVNALIGSMLRNGYLSELANSILVSVDSRDMDAGTKLQAKLTDEIGSLLQAESFEGAVLSQTVTKNGELQRLADENGITRGKAQLVRELVESNPLYSFGELAKLSVNELNLLSESGKTAAPGVESVGSASDKAYIGGQKAKELALAKAGVPAADAFGLSAELDFDDGSMVYEVEFTANGVEYDYELDARTGEILREKSEPDDDAPRAPEALGGALLTPDRAKEIAKKGAGISEGALHGYDVSLDTENGVKVYEVEFTAGGVEYDIVINAETGEILHRTSEPDDDPDDFYGGGSHDGAPDDDDDLDDDIDDDGDDDLDDDDDDDDDPDDDDDDGDDDDDDDD